MKSRSTLLAAALCVSMLIPPVSVGAANETSAPTRLSEVIVTASRGDSPFAALSIDELDLRTAAVTDDTAALLTGIPGVHLYGSGGMSSLPSIRGLADDRLRVKVDGMDLLSTCPNHMNPALSYIDPSSVKSVRVYAGIAPVSLGGDSIGGTIAVDSAEPRFAKADEPKHFEGRAGTQYRSNSDRVSGDLSVSLATETVNVSYAGSAVGQDNYHGAKEFKRTTSTAHEDHALDLDEVGSSAYEAQSHSLGIAWRSENSLLEARMAYQDIPYQLYPNQRMDMVGNTEYRPSLKYTGKYDWGLLEALAYYQDVDHEMNFGDDKRFWYGSLSGTGFPCTPGVNCADGMPMRSEGDTVGTTLKASIDLADGSVLRVGNQTQIYRLEDYWPASGSNMWPGTFVNINDGQRDRVALFAEWDKRHTDLLTTSLGARYEWVRTDAGDVRGYNPSGAGNQGRDAARFNERDRDNDDHNWDSTALTKWTLHEGLNIEAGYAHKTRSPNLYERYAWSTWSMPAVMINWFGDGNGYIGNIDLDPEQADTVSAALDWHDPDLRWKLRVSPYYTRVHDYIDAIQWNATTDQAATTIARDQFSVLKFVNQTAQLYGIDVSGSVLLAETPAGKFGLDGLFSYTNGENLDTDDELYNIMPANAGLTLTHRIGGWSGAVETVWVAEKDDISDMRNEIKTKPYGLVHLRGRYVWDRFRIDLGIENVLDKKYAHPLGGAYVGQGASMMLNPTDGILSWGTPVPGPGRSFYAGVTIEF